MPTWRTLLRYWVTSLEALPSLAVSLVIWWLVVDDGSLRTYFWPMAKKNLIFFLGDYIFSREFKVQTCISGSIR